MWEINPTRKAFGPPLQFRRSSSTLFWLEVEIMSRTLFVAETKLSLRVLSVFASRVMIPHDEAK